MTFTKIINFNYTRFQQANNKGQIFILNFLFIIMFVQSEIAQMKENGYNFFYFENGNVSSEGTLINGKPDGYWKTYYENGEIKTEGKRTNFLLDSVWVFYFENGNIHQKISYSENKRNGLLSIFNENGALLEKTNYLNDKKNGNAIFYQPIDSGDNSFKIKDLVYENDLQQGIAYEYDHSGKIITIMEYNKGILKSKDVINRFDLNGKKNGKWVEFFSNGNIKWEGKYIHGVLNGNIKTFNKKGGIESLEYFENGKIVEERKKVNFEIEKEINNDGTITYGVIADNKKQGSFRKYDSTGKLIDCINYKNDIKLSNGLVDSLNLKQGEWKYFYPEGDLKAIGLYKNDLLSGKWIYYHSNKTLQQVGEYKNGKPVGVWKWYYNNEQLHRIETFVKGKEDGEIIEYDSIGVVITKGIYVNGIKDGSWYYKVNDFTEEGSFVDGEKQGEWTSKYMNGNISFKGKYINGIPDEKHVYYHQNGKVKLSGKYNNGQKEGDWKKYNETGEVVLTIQYKRGEEYKIDGVKIKKK